MRAFLYRQVIPIHSASRISADGLAYPRRQPVRQVARTVLFHGDRQPRDTLLFIDVRMNGEDGYAATYYINALQFVHRITLKDTGIREMIANVLQWKMQVNLEQRGWNNGSDTYGS